MNLVAIFCDPRRQQDIGLVIPVPEGYGDALLFAHSWLTAWRRGERTIEGVGPAGALDWLRVNEPAVVLHDQRTKTWKR